MTTTLYRYSGSEQMYHIKREFLSHNSQMQFTLQPYIPRDLELILDPIL